MKNKQVTITLTKKDKEILEEGARLSGLSFSSFIRKNAILDARKILIENNLEVSE